MLDARRAKSATKLSYVKWAGLAPLTKAYLRPMVTINMRATWALFRRARARITNVAILSTATPPTLPLVLLTSLDGLAFYNALPLFNAAAPLA